MDMRALTSQTQHLTAVVSVRIEQRIEELLSLAEEHGLGDVIHWHCVSEYKKEPGQVTEGEFEVLLEKFFPLISELALQKLESGRRQ